MNRRSAIGNLLLTGLVSSLPLEFAIQPDNRPQDFTIRSNVRLVLLDVSVKDRRGNLVAGLVSENFRVLENGKPQPITVFANADLPVTVGILVDESLSMGRKRADVLMAAQTFVEESNPHDETFVLNFNDKVKRGLPRQTLFSDNIQQLRSALYRGVPEGKTALYDAVVAGLKQLELGRRDKKTLVVISDGGDTASEHTRREMLDLVERSTATIYTIGLFDADDPDHDIGILQRLAQISGGESYFPKSTEQMIPVCRGIAKNIRARYTIGYLPQNGKPGNARRQVRVLASAPAHQRLVAHTRSSYWYDDTANQEAAREE